ncbi:patatin-like phospholipase family protein [Variovorax sp. UC122_21]|uniref:patatin-like phospholipase family protein n=1 Tax=Variovorax sp. UC122_21 TaxID=3374554 RepID=UPI003756F9C9
MTTSPKKPRSSPVSPSPRSPSSTTRRKSQAASAARKLEAFVARREDMRSARKALVLQGGGALGAYQAGVYAALSETELQPHWIAGVSIGAINAALIAGNAPEHRVDRLREFWHLVSSGPSQRLPSWLGDRATQNQWSATMASLVGIPGFFEPRYSPALLLGGAAPLLSYYDTTPLKATLERLVDFDRINHCEARFSVGAVNVRTGNSVYFDNTRQRIGPEHIMASGALPPGFAPVHIDGDDYWDGGIVSNTPLQYVLDLHPRSEPLVVLQVDLFNARGEMPRTLSGVMERQKDITYSSRTRMNTDALAANMNLQQAIADLIEKLPPHLRRDAAVEAVQAELTHHPIDIFHLIYRDKPYELESKDYEFSRAAVEEHWESGARDMRRVLAHPETLRSDAAVNGVTTFDLGEGGSGRVKRPGLSR